MESETRAAPLAIPASSIVSCDPLVKLSRDLRRGVLDLIISSASYDEKANQSNTLTHVSRVWRQIMLTDPTLWSEIHWKHPKWTINTFHRSGSYALAVTIEESEEEEGGGPFFSAVTQGNLPQLFLKIATKHASRIRSLDIRTCRQASFKCLMRHFATSDLSSLTELSLRVIYEEKSHWRSGVPRWFTSNPITANTNMLLTSELLQIIAPQSLAKLHLSNFEFHSVLFPPSNLRHVVISTVVFNATKLANTRLWLTHAKQLRCLEFRSCGFTLDDEWVDTHSPDGKVISSLKELRFIAITPPHAWHRVCKQLGLPTSAVVQLTGYFTDPNTHQDDLGILLILETIFPTTPKAQKIAIVCTSGTGYRLAGVSLSSGDTRLFKFLFMHGHRVPVDMFRSIFDLICCHPHVHEVQVTIDDPSCTISTTQWMSFLRYPKLSCLVLLLSDCRAVLQALVETIVFQGPGSLEILTFEGSVFGPASSASVDVTLQDQPAWNMLSKYVELMHVYDRPLRKVGLHLCGGVSKKQAESLAAYVKDGVEFTGEIIPYEEEEMDEDYEHDSSSVEEPGLEYDSQVEETDSSETASHEDEEDSLSDL